jgi:uncharacterized membrane protein YbhN (UPF0104 family)
MSHRVRAFIRRGWVRSAGSCLGVLLFVAAIVIALRQGGAAWGSVPESIMQRPWLAGFALALPGASWIVTSAIFWVLLAPASRDRLSEHRVPWAEMAALIGAAGLLNYLPLKPGLVGRVAYHHARHGILPRESITSVVQAIGIGAGCIALLLGVTLLREPWALLAVPMIPTVAALTLLSPGQRQNGLWRFAVAATLRGIDLLLWMARVSIAFELVGQPLTLTQAAAVTAVSQAALLIPIAGNGLGVREWVTALVASSLPSAGAVGVTKAAGLSADLINRAAELSVAIPLGVVCLLLLLRRYGRKQTGESIKVPDVHVAPGDRIG